MRPGERKERKSQLLQNDVFKKRTRQARRNSGSEKRRGFHGPQTVGRQGRKPQLRREVSSIRKANRGGKSTAPKMKQLFINREGMMCEG